MKREWGFGFLHLILALIVVVAALGFWKHQYKKEALVAQRQEQEAVEKLHLEQQKLAEINIKVEDAHRQELETQKRVYESINVPIPVPDQSSVTSKSLPILAWRAVGIGLNKAEIGDFAKATKQFISASLKDPGSAVFADMRIFRAEHSDGGYTFICGKINAKNSFGGYTGFQNYIVHKGKPGTIEGGIGDVGSISAVNSEGKWWSYDADDMCFIHGFPVSEE